MPCSRQISLVGFPASASFSTPMICSSVNCPLRMSSSLAYPEDPTSHVDRFSGGRSPQLPAEFGGVVSNITGLDNLHAIKPMIGRVTAPPTAPGPRPKALRSPSSRIVPALATLAHGRPDVILCRVATVTDHF